MISPGNHSHKQGRFCSGLENSVRRFGGQDLIDYLSVGTGTGTIMKRANFSIEIYSGRIILA